MIVYISRFTIKDWTFGKMKVTRIKLSPCGVEGRSIIRLQLSVLSYLIGTCIPCINRTLSTPPFLTADTPLDQAVSRSENVDKAIQTVNITSLSLR